MVELRTMNIEEKALDIAQETAREAGEKILPLFGRTLVIKEKESPTDISSEADLLAEKIIFSKLSPNFKNFNYLSEEQEFIDKGSEYTWVVDPLDGSIPFVWPRNHPEGGLRTHLRRIGKIKCLMF